MFRVPTWVVLVACRADGGGSSTRFSGLFAFYNPLYGRLSVSDGACLSQDLEISLVGGALFCITGVS